MYEEFQDVGLMTGDVTINPTASVIIMTTEVSTKSVLKLTVFCVQYKEYNKSGTTERDSFIRNLFYSLYVFVCFLFAFSFNNSDIQ